MTSLPGRLLEQALGPLRRSAWARRLRDTRLGAHLAWWLTVWRASLAGYETNRQARLAERRDLYRPTPAVGLLSLMTPVWNTDPAYLRALADSIFAQDDAPAFEWLIQDNASTRADTRAVLAELARHPAVRLERSETNLGIIGGMRRCLERATGRYVLPIDHDDWLYPDALRIVAWHLDQAGYPALFYTDEDKLYGARHCYPYFKPDWDPVLFVNAAYIAHQCGFDRAQALALGAWSERAYEGCHDWDAFLRFAQAGHRPLHVPEVLYAWRIHAGSTAGNIRSKDFIADSQRALLARVIAAAAKPARYAIEPNPFFPGTPNWHIRRLPVDARPVVTVVLGDPDSPAVRRWRTGSAYPAQTWYAVPADAPPAALAALAAAARDQGALLRLLWDQVEPVPPCDDAAALWEAVGLFELQGDAAMVGGRIVDPHDRIRSAGGYFGFGDGCGAPDAGRDLAAPGDQAQLWQQHSVSAVSSELCLLDPALLLATLAAHQDLGIGLPHLGAWCGAQARLDGRRVIYSPFLTGRTATAWAARVDGAEQARFRTRHAALAPDTALRSPRLWG